MGALPMTHSSDTARKFHDSRPRIGDEVTYMGKPHGRVKYVEDSLCWVRYYDEPANPDHRCMPFIWCFKDGLNALHTWPTKQPGLDAPCPGVMHTWPKEGNR